MLLNFLRSNLLNSNATSMGRFANAIIKKYEYNLSSNFLLQAYLTYAFHFHCQYGNEQEQYVFIKSCAVTFHDFFVALFSQALLESYSLLLLATNKTCCCVLVFKSQHRTTVPTRGYKGDKNYTSV